MFALRKNLFLGVLSLVLLAFAANPAFAMLTDDDPVTIGQTFLAGSMDPTDGSNGWSLTSHGVAEKLFTVDEYGEIVPQVAASVSKVDEFTWDLALKDGYKFSDGTPVDAQHVVDSLTELNTINSSAQSSLGAMTVTVGADDKTVRIVSERPSHVMDAVLAEWVFTVYTKDSNGDFIFTGPYAIQTFGSDEIELMPNPYYIDGKSLHRPLIVLQKFADGHDLAESAKKHEIDIGFHLPIDTLVHLREMDGVHVKSFEVGYHYMMFHNMDSLDDVNVRKAIDLAIDRTALTQALSGGTGTRSLFPDYSPYYSDTSDPHGDAANAAKLLDDAGWTLNSATGKREKDGAPLTVTLVAYPHRPGLVIMQPVIEDSLDALGFTVNAIVTGMDWDETATIMNDRSFDLLMWAQHTLPAGDPLWFLSSFFRSDGGSNHANLQSADVDVALDALSNAEVHSERVQLAADTQSEILSNVPVSNLVTPFWHVSLSDRMADYKPWGSDYYVVRADLFASDVKTNGDKETEATDFVHEWAAVFPVTDATHQYLMQEVDGKYADAFMRVVLVPTTELNIEGIHTTEGAVAALMNGDSCEIVENEGTGSAIAETGSCYELVVDTTIKTNTFNLVTEGLTGLAVYTQHVPFEFEDDMHFFKDSAGADIEPVAEESAGGHGHGHGHGSHGSDDEVSGAASFGGLMGSALVGAVVAAAL